MFRLNDCVGKSTLEEMIKIDWELYFLWLKSKTLLQEYINHEIIGNCIGIRSHGITLRTSQTRNNLLSEKK